MGIGKRIAAACRLAYLARGEAAELELRAACLLRKAGVVWLGTPATLANALAAAALAALAAALTAATLATAPLATTTGEPSAGCLVRGAR